MTVSLDPFGYISAISFPQGVEEFTFDYVLVADAITTLTGPNFPGPYDVGSLVQYWWFYSGLIDDEDENDPKTRVVIRRKLVWDWSEANGALTANKDAVVSVTYTNVSDGDESNFPAHTTIESSYSEFNASVADEDVREWPILALTSSRLTVRCYAYSIFRSQTVADPNGPITLYSMNWQYMDADTMLDGPAGNLEVDRVLNDNGVVGRSTHDFVPPWSNDIPNGEYGVNTGAPHYWLDYTHDAHDHLIHNVASGSIVSGAVTSGESIKFIDGGAVIVAHDIFSATVARTPEATCKDRPVVDLTGILATSDGQLFFDLLGIDPAGAGYVDRGLIANTDGGWAIQYDLTLGAADGDILLWLTDTARNAQFKLDPNVVVYEVWRRIKMRTVTVRDRTADAEIVKLQTYTLPSGVNKILTGSISSAVHDESLTNSYNATRTDVQCNGTYTHTEWALTTKLELVPLVPFVPPFFEFVYHAPPNFTLDETFTLVDA